MVKEDVVCVCVYIYPHIYICGYIYTHTYIHTIEFYSVIKKKEIMPFAATWVDPEIIILSGLS